MQRVVVDGDLVAFVDAAVVAHAGAPGRPQAPGCAPGSGRKPAVGVLRVDAALDGVAALLQVLLAEGQRLPLGDADLQLHQVVARHHLGDRVLHLQPRVHLEEVGVPLLVHQELERARVHVAHPLHEGHRERAHPLAQLRGDEGRRALLDHLLVAPLDRALALEEVHGVPVGVGQDLDLDVARARDRLLEVDAVVAEGALRLAAGARDGRRRARRRRARAAGPCRRPPPPPSA